MDSDKSNSKYRLLASIILISYLYFLFFDYKQQLIQKQKQEQEENRHFYRIQTNSPIDNIIFGGSNALNSLSAEQMTHATGQRWDNASMNGEMGNINAYTNFISRYSSKINSSQVNNVIYSSIIPYTPDAIALYSRIINEDLKVAIRPSRSGFSYIMNFLSRINDIPSDEVQYNDFGDYTNNNKNCVFIAQHFKHEKIENISNYLIARSIFLSREFSSAHIFIVLPSIYYGESTPSFPDFKYNLHLIFKQDLVLRAPELINRVSLIVQPQYPSNQHICSDGHHAVPLGRTWRTSNLLTYLGYF